MTTSPDTDAGAATEGGFTARQISAAERELEEILATARALGIETEEQSAEAEIDTTAAEALVELGLDRPVEPEETPIASFLQEDESEEPAPTISLEGIQESDAAWFAINTYTGYEISVLNALDKRIQGMDAEEYFVELRPEQAGKTSRRSFQKRFVLQIRLDQRTGELPDKSWYVVSGTSGVTGFVGAREDQRDRPRPLPPAEVVRIIGQTQVEEPQIRVGFEIGDSVRLTDGPFVDMVAEVEEINIDKGKVRVRISMFGRETPLELDFDQVEKQ